MPEASRNPGVHGSAADAGWHAPLFRSLVEDLRGGGRRVVLDLGTARSANLGLFRHFRVRLYVADVGGGLLDLSSLSDPERLRRRAEALLPRTGPEPLDLVLCWDLLNYLGRDAMAALMTAIARRCRPGALAHGFIVSSRPRMPRDPGAFDVIADDRVQRVGPTEPERPAPRYTAWDLDRCMPDYVVDRSVLLQDGRQEYLMRLRTPPR